MSYWMVVYDMTVDSNETELTQTICDMVEGESYYDVINRCLAENVGKVADKLKREISFSRRLSIEVDLIEVKEYRAMVK